MNASKPSSARERHWVCAQRIRGRRRALGLTQREVVGRLQHRGHQISNRALSAMENGRGLDLGLLPELADSLECTVTYLLGLAADPSSWRPDRANQSQGNQATRGTRVDGPEIPNGLAAPGRLRPSAAATESAGGAPL